MRLKKSVATTVVVVSLSIGLGACSSGVYDTRVNTSVQEQTQKSKPNTESVSSQRQMAKVVKPKDESDEENDVSNLRFEKEPGDGTYVFAACTIKNHSQEMSDYLIEVEAIYPDPSFAAKTATIRAAHVPPGAKVPCPQASFLSDFNPNEWKLSVVRIDRTPTAHKHANPDEQLSSDYLDLRHGEAGSAVNFSLTNYAKQKSDFVVKYEIPDANGVNVYRGSYELKNLAYLENRTGSIPVPEDVLNKLKASLGFGETLEDLTEVRLLDVDRKPSQ